MNIVLIQVLLIAVVVAVAARLFRSGGARSQAVRRLGLLLFAGFAVVSILVPDVWNRIARLVGVGRGTDMVLYALAARDYPRTGGPGPSGGGGDGGDVLDEPGGRD